MIAEYLEHALQFERMASEESDPALKESLARQAEAYRDLATERAARLHLPLPSEPPHKRGAMREYRAYLLGSHGQILGRSDFKCDDDDAALEYARKNVLTKSIEVWQGERLVGTVHPGDKPKPH